MLKSRLPSLQPADGDNLFIWRLNLGFMLLADHEDLHPIFRANHLLAVNVESETFLIL